MKLKKLLKKFNYTCFYCKRYISLSEATRDHYYPDWRGSKYKRRGGGNHTRGKCILACRFCNQLKGNMMPEDFIKKIRNKEIFILK